MVCDRINATIFKKVIKNKRNNSSDHTDMSLEEKYEEELKQLSIGDNIIIKIKNIKYEQNNLFITASFEKIAK